MVFYFTNNENTFRVNLQLTSQPEENSFLFQLWNETSLISEGSIQSKKVGEEFYYTLDQKKWNRFPKHFSTKQCLGMISYQIYSGFLPSTSKGPRGGDGLIISQMPGKITKLIVKKGQAIAEGQSLLVMEAMKMENEVKANTSGVVEEIFVSESQNVESSAPLIKISKA